MERPYRTGRRQARATTAKPASVDSFDQCGRERVACMTSRGPVIGRPIFLNQAPFEVLSRRAYHWIVGLGMIPLRGKHGTLKTLFSGYQGLFFNRRFIWIAAASPGRGDRFVAHGDSHGLECVFSGPSPGGAIRGVLLRSRIKSQVPPLTGLQS